jgi:DNA-binding winged helix-turn-helix (wHTH) protein/predicted ATPase
MEQDQQIVFGPFRFDRTTQCLWHGVREIRLRPRTRAVLRYLVEHAGRVIARQELAQHVWKETHVSQSVLRVCIWELRQALDDQGNTPQYIETVGQQGYRFCAEIGPAAPDTRLVAPFVGRQAELAALQTALDEAKGGVPQLVFVAGEAGIGKTTLVRRFLAQMPATAPLWIGRGQCVEHFGPAEAYLPLLEALGRLGQEPAGERCIAALRRVAPTWLVQLPLLVEPDERERLQRQVQGTSAERMLREFVDALTVMTRDIVVVLVLEDLQWSDTATVEALAYVARRQERLRLLVLGTYRPADVIARGHPLRQTLQELLVHRLCGVLQLELLVLEEVQAYVAQRLGAQPAPTDLGRFVHQRTNGNALFMVHMLDHLLHQGWLSKQGNQWVLRSDLAAVDETVPEGVRALLGQQVEACNAAEQQVLETASVSGGHFTAAEVAAGRQCAVEEVEALCDGLTRRELFLEAQEVVTWPDGTQTAQYGFRHGLYRDVLYARLGPAQRLRLHCRVGERLEAGYGQKVREVAGVLALHFTQGQDYQRAVQYWQQAAEQALSRSAYAEARTHCTTGLALLAMLPESPARAAQELALRLTLSTVLAVTEGYAAEALAANLQQALALCQMVEATTEVVPVLTGLTRLFMIRSERPATERLLAQQRALLPQLHDAASLVLVHTQLGTAEAFRGAYIQAQEHQTHVLRLYNPERHRSLALQFGNDPAVTTLAGAGWRLWLTGLPDQAAEQTARALAYAETLEHPFSLAIALFSVALVRQGRGELSAALESAQRLRTVGHEQGFRLYEALGTMMQGSVLVQRGELAHGQTLLTTGLAQYRHLGCQSSLTFFLSFLAETHLRQGQAAEGLAVVAEALRLTDSNFDRFWEAELHRLRGDLLLAQTEPRHSASGTAVADAEACFQQALAVAQQQGAKALELRAALSLSRLCQAQAQHAAARALLARIYGSFTEGFDTADLQAARAMLEGLERIS